MNFLDHLHQHHLVLEGKRCEHIKKYHSEKKKSEMNPKEKKVTPMNYEVLDEEINSAKSKRRKLD